MYFRFADSEIDVAGLEWKFDEFVTALELKQGYIAHLATVERKREKRRQMRERNSQQQEEEEEEFFER